MNLDNHTKLVAAALLVLVCMTFAATAAWFRERALARERREQAEVTLDEGTSSFTCIACRWFVEGPTADAQRAVEQHECLEVIPWTG